MFDLNIRGKIAVVPGGAAGIGFSIVEGLARNGARVVIGDVDPVGAERAAALKERGYDVHFRRTDVRSKEDTDKLAEEVDRRCGGADYLINVAGIYPFLDVLETTEEVWDQVLDINLKGMYLCCRAFVPHMIRKGKGAIVNIGSSNADGGMPELFAYSVSKGGVNTLTRNLASALSNYRIRVNCVNPGWVSTDKEIAQRAAMGLDRKWIEEQGQTVPLGRMQTGEDAAAAVLFLISDQASQITGQVLHVDGGTGVINWHDKRRKQ